VRGWRGDRIRSAYQLTKGGEGQGRRERLLWRRVSEGCGGALCFESLETEGVGGGFGTLFRGSGRKRGFSFLSRAIIEH